MTRDEAIARMQIIRYSTARAVIGVAAVASCEHAHALVRAHGQQLGWQSQQPPWPPGRQAYPAGGGR